MIRVLVIIFCLISMTSAMIADEKEYSTDDITQRTKELECESYMNTILAYKQICEDVSQDTVYANLVLDYGSLCFKIGNYETAIEATSEASEIYKSVYGKDHPGYAKSLT